MLELRSSLQIQREVLQIRRSEWLDVLYDGVGKDIPVQLQKGVQSLYETSDGVEAMFTDGSQARFDLGIGLMVFAQQFVLSCLSLPPLVT